MRGTVRLAAMVAALLVGLFTLPTQSLAQTPPPLAPGVSASLDRARAERGARMSVAILVYGPGSYVFEKFGHIALALTDSSTGEEIAFNWGMFDFNQPNFLGRFLTGDTKYWMAGYRTADFNASYMGDNRRIRRQELHLSPTERGAIADFLAWNVADANKYYRYDYYADNCATRVRDLLNWALRGALKPQFDVTGGGRTWRNETARITADDPFVYPGIQIALGRHADQPLRKWEESFLPDLLANHLADVTVRDSSGALVKLVRHDSVLFSSSRTPLPDEAPSRLFVALIIGLVLSATIVLCAAATAPAVRVALAVFASLWFGIGAFLGTALLLAGTVTKHAPYMGANVTLLQLHPMLAVAMVVVPLALVRGRRSNAAVGITALLAVLAAAGVFLQGVPSWSQQSGVVMAITVPVHVAFALAMRRLGLRTTPPTP